MFKKGILLSLLLVLLIPSIGISAKSKKKTFSVDVGQMYYYEDNHYFHKYGSLKSGDTLYMYEGQKLYIKGNLTNILVNEEDSEYIDINDKYLDEGYFCIEVSNNYNILEKIDKAVYDTNWTFQLDKSKSITLNIKVISEDYCSMLKNLINIIDRQDSGFIDETLYAITSTTFTNKTLSKAYVKVINVPYAKEDTKYYKINALSNKTITANMSGIDNEYIELDYVIKINNLFIESEDFEDMYDH